MLHELESVLIKPGSTEESKYLNDYHIELNNLPNGITIVGIPCKMDSIYFARIRWEFAEGAYGNPPGAVHFIEHFINRKIRPLAQLNFLNIYASTSNTDVIEEISGTANPSVLNYGVWTVLDKVRKSLASPLSNSANLEKDSETERKIIKAEVKRNDSEHDYQVWSNWRKIVYAPDNPLRSDPSITGNFYEVDNITIDELKRIEEKIFIPKNLQIGIYTEGDISIVGKIADRLVKLYSDFPKEEKRKNNLDRSLLQSINKKFIPGAVYKHDHGLKNGIISTQFNWILDNKLPEVKYFAANLVKNTLETELTAYSRKKGWGYYTEATLWTLNDKLQLLTLRVDENKGTAKNLESGIRDVLGRAKLRTESVVKLEKKRHTAAPFSIGDRFSWIFDGLKIYGAMINADNIRSIMLEVKSNDINDLLDQILATKPVTIITGDLS